MDISSWQYPAGDQRHRRHPPGQIRRRQQPVPPDFRRLPPPLGDELVTDQIELVAYLMCMGLMVLRYARDPQLNKVFFAFPGRVACLAHQQEFMLGEGLVLARMFAANLDWARTAIHSV